MEKKVVLLSWWLFFAGLACDDISKAPKDPRAPLDQIQAAEPAPQNINKDRLSKVSLIQTYNLIVETRNTVTGQAVKLESLKTSKDPLFYLERSKFLEWVGQRNTVIRVREELLNPEFFSYPKEHPAALLFLAIRAEKAMIDQYIYHFQLDRELPPNIDGELKQYLVEFQEKMKTWEWPVEEQKPPTIQR